MPTTETNRGLVHTLLKEPITFLGGLLLFLMAFSPSYNVVFKVILILLIVVTIFLSRIIYDKLNVTKEVLLWYGLFIAHGVFFSLLGVVYKNNIGYILRSTTYNIVWPVFYLIFTIGIYKKSTLSFIVKTIVLSNFFISVYIIASTLTLFGVLPTLPFISFEMAHQDFDTLAGLVKTQTPSVISLLYTVPFVTALAMIDRKGKFGFNKWFYNLSILVSILAIICTARRALILNIFLGFILTIVFAKRCRGLNQPAFNSNVRKVFLWAFLLSLVALVLLQRLGFFDYTLVYEKFISAFSSGGSEDVSTSIRYDQFNLLIKSWLEDPLLGHGHGAVSKYVIRSFKTPWIYELTYVALLFQTGVIGLTIYMILLLWPIYRGVQLLKNAGPELSLFVIPSIVGWACFFIGNGTNPYLSSYDYIWALFFPVLVMNFVSKEVHARQ